MPLPCKLSGTAICLNLTVWLLTFARMQQPNTSSSSIQAISISSFSAINSSWSNVSPNGLRKTISLRVTIFKYSGVPWSICFNAMMIELMSILNVRKLCNKQERFALQIDD